MIPDLPTLMRFGAFLPRALAAPVAPGGRLREAVEGAVERALADAPRPIAVALSGGVDSAVVAAVARAVVGPELRAYALDTGRAVSEATPAARALGLTLEVVPLPAGVRVTTPAQVAVALGCPTHSAAPFGFLALYRALADRGVATVLTGDGADEAFAGHAYHRAPPAEWPDVWDTWRRHRGLGMRVADWLRPDVDWRPPWETSLAARAVAAEVVGMADPAARLRHLDVRLRMGPQCVDLQRALARHCGLAYRAPLADRAVVAAALAQPVAPDRPKAPLRALAGALLGRPTPPKQPMFTPTGGRPLDAAWQKWLNPARVAAEGLFRPATIERAVAAWSPADAYVPRALVVAATTHAWRAHRRGEE